MDNKKKEEESKTTKKDKLNNSEVEFLKSSNELKIFDILEKVKTENTERKSNKSKVTVSENKEKSENQIDEEEEILEESDDHVKIEKKSIQIVKTTAAEVLKESKLDPKENFDLLKIDLVFLAKKEFKWVVYRTPSDTRSFFKKLYKMIKNDENAIRFGFINS
jgi:hypothetical protein